MVRRLTRGQELVLSATEVLKPFLWASKQVESHWTGDQEVHLKLC